MAACLDEFISSHDVAHRRSLGGATASLGPVYLCVCLVVVVGCNSATAKLDVGESQISHQLRPNLISAQAKLYIGKNQLNVGFGHPLQVLSLQDFQVCLEVVSATSGAGFRIARLSRDCLYGGNRFIT